MNGPLQISELVSLRGLAREMGIDRKAVAAIVKRFDIPVLAHPSFPRAKLLGPDEAEAVRRILTPEQERRGA